MFQLISCAEMTSGIINEFCAYDYFVWSYGLQFPLNSTENDWKEGEDQDPVHFLHVQSIQTIF